MEIMGKTLPSITVIISNECKELEFKSQKKLVLIKADK
jgi:hypothetical protein